jgi:enamine deaminase RidA (YjgF/YER057c/UK114 family)
MSGLYIFPQLLFFTFMPTQGGDINTQLQSCYSQLEEKLNYLKISKENILKQTLFVNASNNSLFFSLKKSIDSTSSSFFNISIPTTVVAQPPQNNSIVSVEFIILASSENLTILHKTYSETDFIILQSPDFKMLVSGGLSFDSAKTDILLQSEKSFDLMQNTLKTEGFDFSNVIRQWNYIENITNYTDQIDGKSQHYQIFNDIRSQYYQNSNFVTGYPAATGIGTNSGGVVIDFIALKGNENILISPIKSPVQTDAHKYSHEVLAPNIMHSNLRETTPKFERAKLISSGKNTTVFVSGTAAIKGENTIPDSDVTVQTKVTFENIEKLTSDQNLSIHGLILPYKEKSLSLIRVYVKYETDIVAVQKICESSYKNIPCIIVQSDICRDNLLVEVEAVYDFEY